MQKYTFMDLVNRTMTGEEVFYNVSEVDARIAELERSVESLGKTIRQMQIRNSESLDLGRQGCIEACKTLGLQPLAT